MRIYAVPIEHEKAFNSFTKKLHDGVGPISGRVVFVTEEELKAILSQTVIDIPDEGNDG